MTAHVLVLAVSCLMCYLTGIVLGGAVVWCLFPRRVRVIERFPNDGTALVEVRVDGCAAPILRCSVLALVMRSLYVNGMAYRLPSGSGLLSVSVDGVEQVAPVSVECDA